MKIFEKQIFQDALEGRDLPLPSEVIFEPTVRCNLKCTMCFYSEEHFKPKYSEMTDEEIKTCVSKMPASVKHAVLIGGEPLFHRNFEGIAACFAEKGINLTIATNGVLLNSKLVDKLHVIGNIKRVTASLDGPPEIHNKIRGVPQAFEKTFGNLKYASKYFEIEIVSVLQHDNTDYLNKLIPYISEIQNVHFAVELAREYPQQVLDLTAFQLNLPVEELHLRAESGASSKNDIQKQLLNLHNIRRNAARRGVNFHTIPQDAAQKIPLLSSRTAVESRIGRYCDRLRKARVDSRGNLIHCYALRKPLGSLLEDSFEDIWNGGRYKKFRSEILRKGLYPICPYCFACREPSRPEGGGADIAVGLVGTGAMARQYAAALSQLQHMQLKGVCSKSEERARNFAQTYEVESFNLDDAASVCDAVIVCGSPDAHIANTIRIVERDSTNLRSRHVLIEKPLGIDATSLNIAEKVYDDHPGVNFFASSQGRYNWPHTFLSEVIASGDFGAPQRCTIKYMYDRPMSYYNEGNPWRREISGNVVFNQGIHIFDLVYDLFGMPSAVKCKGTVRRHTAVELDTAFVELFYDNDFVIDIEISTAGKSEDELIDIKYFGKSGFLHVSSSGIRQYSCNNLELGTLKRNVNRHFLPLLSQVLLSRLGKRIRPMLVKLAGRIPSAAGRHLAQKSIRWTEPWNPHDLMLQIREFEGAIKGTQSYRVTYEDGLRVARIAVASYLSFKQQDVVSMESV